MRPLALRRATTALLAAALLVTACGDDDAGTTTPDATSTTAESSTTAADDTTTTTEAAPQEDESTIEVSVSGDSVTGGGRHRVPLGHTVHLQVTSDQDDEVHLHGYDLTLDLEAGSPATLTFDATIPGVFEAELHDSGIILVELEIS